jgi:hypothetical protein
MKRVFSILAIAALIVGFSSCDSDEFLEPTLAQDKSIETSIKSQEDIEGILRGAYNRMSHNFYYGRDYIIFNEVRADNVFSNGNSGRFVTAAAMTIGEADAYTTDTWTKMYEVIASANIIIAQDAAAMEGDAEAIKHAQGQAYIIRAMVHFDLLRLYGQQHVTGGNNVGIPYVKEYKGDNLKPSRNTVAEVQQFIYDDLDQAMALMNTDYDPSTKEFLSKISAEALRSRVALYFGDWTIARDASLAVINSGLFSIMPAASFAASFAAKNSANVIFEIANRPTDNVGINGLSYIYRGTSYGDIQVIDEFANIFDATDVRLTDVMGVVSGALRNNAKYPTNANYDYNIPLLRYEEVILNYAEALWRISAGDANALTQLNLITANRGAVAHASISEDIILLERRRELAFEGFRFHDLARTGRAIPVISIRQTHGGPAYGDFKYAFPIPISELNANSNIQQNFGH